MNAEAAVTVAFRDRTTALGKELKASETSPAVHEVVARALFGTRLSFILLGDLCQAVSETEEEKFAARQAQASEIDKLRQMAAVGRDRLEDVSAEVFELLKNTVEQQEAAIEELESMVVSAYGLSIGLWRQFTDLMESCLVDLYKAADRKAIIELMKKLLGRIVGLTPVGGIVGLIKDLKGVYDLRDGTAAAAELAGGVGEYEEYVLATINWSIIASRMAEACQADGDTDVASIMQRALARIEDAAQRF